MGVGRPQPEGVPSRQNVDCAVKQLERCDYDTMTVSK